MQRKNTPTAKHGSPLLVLGKKMQPGNVIEKPLKRRGGLKVRIPRFAQFL
jgi:hypothetical protein